MRITKEGNELVLRVALTQENYDAVGERVGDAPNLVGVVAGRECSLSFLIALGYKDDIQEGSPLIMFDTEEELRKVCSECGFDVWVLPLCAHCGDPIRGAYTMDEKGNVCNKCEK